MSNMSAINKSCDVCGEKIPSREACKACEYIFDEEHIAPTPVPEPVRTIKIKVKKIKKVLIIVEDSDEEIVEVAPEPEPEPVVVVDEVISYNDDLIFELDNTGIDNLISIYGGEFKRRISNMKSSSIPLVKRRTLITTKIMEAVVKSEDKNHAKKIIDLYFAKKPKQEKPDADWVADFVVGEEVIVTNAPQQDTRFSRTIHRKGKITKINKKSVSVGLFGYNEIDDKNALANQTHGSNKLIWWNFTNDSKVVFDRKSIVKKGQYSWIDAEFNEGRMSVDYGN